MKVFVRLFVLVMLCSVGENAVSKRGGVGYFLAGYSAVNFDSLNDILRAKGYPEVSGKVFSVGGGGYGVVADRIVLGGEGNMLFNGESENRGYRDSISAGYGVSVIGYIVYSGNNLVVYPFAGLGGGGATLSVSSNEAVSGKSFDEVLNNLSYRGVELSTDGFIAGLGLGSDYLMEIKTKTDDKGEKGVMFFLVGIRIGYNFTFGWGDWSANGLNIPDGPETGLEGPFVKIAVGFVRSRE